MKFEDFVDFLNWIDSLSDKDFTTARALFLLRAMHRELYRVHSPKDRPPQATDYIKQRIT